MNVSHSQPLQHENTYRGNKMRSKVKISAAAQDKEKELIHQEEKVSRRSACLG